MGKENICDDIAIVDLMQAVKPMIKVSRCELESNCDVVEAVCNDSRYFAEDKNISSQVSLVWGRSGALKSCPCGLCELSMSNNLSITRINSTVPRLPLKSGNLGDFAKNSTLHLQQMNLSFEQPIVHSFCAIGI